MGSYVLEMLDSQHSRWYVPGWETQPRLQASKVDLNRVWVCPHSHTHTHTYRCYYRHTDLNILSLSLSHVNTFFPFVTEPPSFAFSVFLLHTDTLALLVTGTLEL